MGDNDTSACREGAKALTLEEAPMARAKGMMIRFITFFGFGLQPAGIGERRRIDWIFFLLDVRLE